MPRLVLAVAVLALAAPTLASPKPCRDAQGRVIQCPKPPRPDTRCRDASGKFVPCPAPSPTPRPIDAR